MTLNKVTLLEAAAYLTLAAVGLFALVTCG